MQKTITRGRTAATAATEIGLRRVTVAVALLAGTALGFQVALPRIFSLVFQYHYVFLVVSLAILGLGGGAAIGYTARRTQSNAEGMSTARRLSLLLALLFPVTALLLSDLNSSDLTPFAVIVALLPFVLLGWINALIYSHYAGQSNFIYGADLIGAAGGILVVVALLAVASPFTVMMICGVAVALASLPLYGAEGRLPRLALGLLPLLAGMALINQLTDFIDYHPERITNAPPDKTMVHLLNDPSANARVIDTRWSPFARIDVVQTNDPDAYYVFTDAGAGSIMVRSDPETGFANYNWIEQEIQYLPFGAGPVQNTLIIGAGAGYDIVLAKHAGAETITAVEINPAIVDVTRQHAAFNGNILDAPGVTTVISDGRNFVDRSSEQFDLIYMNVVYSQAAAPNSAALAENDAFTVEALRSYWMHLSENGRIGIVGHNGLEGVRLLMTALAALQNEGMPLDEALNHIALVMSDSTTDPTRAPSVLLVTRQPWTEQSAEDYRLEITRRSLTPLFIPYVAENALTVLRSGSMSLAEYTAANTDYNIFPTTDNRPFFYHIDAGLPPALTNLLQFALLIASGYFILVAAVQPARHSHEWSRVLLLVYFSLLGAGYLLAEVALQQRFKLLLGDPILSLTVTLGALLLGSGLGSLFGGRFDSGRLPRLIVLSAVGVGLWLAAAALGYAALVALALPQSLPVRVVITMIAILPLGLLMGLPFPCGLRLAAQTDERGIPLYWGMNALASTVGAVGASIIALLAGFQFALLTGALLYLLAAGLMQFSWKRLAL